MTMFEDVLDRTEVLPTQELVASKGFLRMLERWLKEKNEGLRGEKGASK